MKQSKIRALFWCLAGAFLLLCAAPLTFSSCEREHPRVEIPLESDFSEVIAAINNLNSTLTEKLATIQSAVDEGNLDDKEVLELIQQALETMNGTLEQKLGAIKEAVTSQTTSLEMKLDLIYEALNAGLTDANGALGLIKDALLSLKDSVSGDDGLVKKIDEIVKSLGNIDTTLTDDVAKALQDILGAIPSVPDYSDILKAIEKAIKEIELSSGSDDEEDSTIVHEYVEMGDGLKWATCNVGAEKPEEPGDYFAWGETEPKSDYTWSTYKWIETPAGMEVAVDDLWKYISRYTFADGKTSAHWYDGDEFKGDGATYLGDPRYNYQDDAARQNWKGTWRTPTFAEWKVLMDEKKYEWTWTDDYEGTGTAGMIVKNIVEGSEFKGNFIFLPITGARSFNYIAFKNNGYYWSSSLGQDKYSYSIFAKGVIFYSGSYDGNTAERDFGCPIRPVSE